MSRVLPWIVWAIVGIYALVLFAPSVGDPLASKVAFGLPVCAPIKDKNVDGEPEVNVIDYVVAPRRCFPDHPDYVQPEGGWPPDPHFWIRGTEDDPGDLPPVGWSPPVGGHTHTTGQVGQ